MAGLWRVWRAVEVVEATGEQERGTGTVEAIGEASRLPSPGLYRPPVDDGPSRRSRPAERHLEASADIAPGGRPTDSGGIAPRKEFPDH